MTNPSSRPQPISREELETVGTIARRIMNGLSVEPQAVIDPDNLSWSSMTDCTASWLRKGLITGLTATAENEAMSAFARAAAQPALQEQLAEVFYAEPILRHALQSMTLASPPPAIQATVHPQSSAGDGPRLVENLEAWLADPVVHPQAAQSPAPSNGKDGHQPISAACLSGIRDALRGSRDPVDVIFATQDEFDKLTDLAAWMAAEATWCTGLRPAEWPSARLMVHDVRTGEKRAVDDLYSEALADKPPPNPAAHDRIGFLRHVKGILLDILGSGAIWLHVRNAKSNHSEEYGLPRTRAIGLESLPPSGKLSVFCATVLVARADAAGNWAAWCRRINTRLGRLAPEFGFNKLTFYSFRHDFIERAKAALRPEEVAALAGHCSADSKGSYGRPNMRGKRLAAPAIPDPEHVRILGQHFAARREAAMERKAAARQAPSPSPGPSFG